MQPFHIKNHAKTLRALFKDLDTYMVFTNAIFIKDDDV